MGSATLTLLLTVGCVMGVTCRSPAPPSSTREGGKDAGSFQETVVFMFKETVPDQDVFIRGGLDASQVPGGCGTVAETDPCAITMTTNTLGTIAHYEKYNAWRTGDTLLDWNGAQTGQGVYQAVPAQGTPMVWTTDNVLSPGYQELNVYGEHYWMTSMDMDCSQTVDGWFDLKAYITNASPNWEGDIAQAACGGSAGGQAPYTSANHLARCGYINVFGVNVDTCRIDNFPAA